MKTQERHTIVLVYINMGGHNKQELVELITKQKSEGVLDWVSIARDPQRGQVRVNPEEIDQVYAEIKKFRANRASYHGRALNYYLPAFQEIETAREQKDFEAFRKGLDYLLGLIGDD